jgi:hypothetical protein
MADKQLNVTAEQIDAVVGAETVEISTLFTSPTFTGIPIAPTASIGTNTTQLATTAFVLANSSGTGNNLTEGLNALGVVTKGITFGISNPGAGSYTMVDGTAYFSLIYLDEDGILTGVRVGESTQGDYTGDNFNGVALYSVSGNTFTRVAISTTNNDLWKSSYWSIEISFSSPYSATKGLYAVGLLYNSSAETTAPVLTTGTSWGNGMGFTSFGLSYSPYTTLAAQTTLPTSVTATTNNASYLPVVITLY